MVTKAGLVLIAAILGLNQLRREKEYLSGTEVLLDEYDYVIVGGGTTGLVVANRLSEDSNSTVLVIEAGASDYQDEFILTPWIFFFMMGGPLDWQYVSTPQESSKKLFGQKVKLSSGKVLGGTSSMNGVMYQRNNQHDFNAWVKESGAVGWGWEEIKPLFKKIENASEEGLPEGYGTEGNVKIMYTYQTKLTEWVKRAAEAMGYPVMDDDQYGASIGTKKYASNIYNGDRQNSAQAYFWPVWNDRSERLHLLLHSMVDKVNIETDSVTGVKRTTSVEYTSKDGAVRSVRARKEVIISAGVFGTPAILLRSGIGPRQHLEELNIKVEVDSPGVGSNLQDHASYIQNYYAHDLPEGVSVDSGEIFSNYTHYQKVGETPLITPGPLGTSFYINTKHNQFTKARAQDQPDMVFMFNSLEVPATSMYPLIYNFKPTDWRNVMQNANKDRNGKLGSFLLHMNLLHPQSRGTVRLQSTNPNDLPLIDLQLMTAEEDKQTIIRAYRFLEIFMQQKPFSDYDFQLVAQPYCDTTENNNVPRSENFYRCLIENTATTEYHACCTAKMGASNDPMAVLDERLRVRGVEHLRVADMSVMPKIVSGNPVSSCFIIGEKVSVMIIEDWK